MSWRVLFSCCEHSFVPHAGGLECRCYRSTVAISCMPNGGSTATSAHPQVSPAYSPSEHRRADAK